jgi:hypothetical protein
MNTPSQFYRDEEISKAARYMRLMPWRFSRRVTRHNSGAALSVPKSTIITRRIICVH